MHSFIEQAQVYAACHQRLMTRYTHFAGIPVLILSAMILLGFVKIVIPGVYATNLAVLAMILVLIYYFRLNWQLALAITPIFLILLWIASWFNSHGPTPFSIWAFLITFVLGWGLQLYGHFIEGKKPAFMSHWSQTLIAPLFLTAELFFMAGWMDSLKAQIYEPVEEDIQLKR